MSYHQLGEPVRARDHLDWAVRWVDARSDLTPGYLEELKTFRAEAELLLGVGTRK